MSKQIINIVLNQKSKFILKCLKWDIFSFLAFSLFLRTHCPTHASVWQSTMEFAFCMNWSSIYFICLLIHLFNTNKRSECLSRNQIKCKKTNKIKIITCCKCTQNLIKPRFKHLSAAEVTLSVSGS